MHSREAPSESPAEGHLSTRALMRVASTGENHPHLAGCKSCSDQARVLGWGVGDMRVIHESKVQPKRRKDGRPPSGFFTRFVRAEEIGREILKAAASDETEVMDTIVSLRKDSALPQGILWACQHAARLVTQNPRAAREFGEYVADYAEATPERFGRLAGVLLIEAWLMQSQARLLQGEAEAAVELAQQARAKAEDDEVPVFARCRADYFLATAIASVGRTEEALAILEAVKGEFAELQQSSWVGKTEASMAHVYSMRDDPRAFPHWEAAVEHLDPEKDAHNLVSLFINKADLLATLGMRADARIAFSQALELALKSGIHTGIAIAQVNLLQYATEDGLYDEVLKKGPKLVEKAHDLGMANVAFFARLYLAESAAAKGRFFDAREWVDEALGDSDPDIAEERAKLGPIAATLFNDAEFLSRVVTLRRELHEPMRKTG